MNLIHANWLEIVTYGFVLLLTWGFLWGISRTSLKALANLSIGTNLAHILLSLDFRNALLPPLDSPAFPPLAQLIFSIEFAMACFVFLKVFSKLCTPKPGGETDVDKISIVSPSIIGLPPRSSWKTVSRSDWLWTLTTDTCYIATFAILMSFRHLTHHP